MFTPSVLAPTPDPLFVRELKLIDPNLRVEWGYERYLLDRWVIERKIGPERYHRIYRNLIENNEERFIMQPLYDTTKPLFDSQGGQIGFEKVGERKFDLAPEWEWVMFVEEPTQEFRPLDMRTIKELKRIYAWEHHHSLSRAAFEKRAEEEKKEAALDARMADVMKESYKDVERELGIKVQI